IKGQGYPLWVALVFALHVPLLFAQQLLYVLACLAVCRALAPSLRSPVAQVILYAVLLFNPMSVHDDTAIRVTREGLYPALVLLFAGAAGVALRLNARRRDVLAWTALLSVALALFWHTREEGVWFLPLLACAALALFRTNWRRAAVVVACPLLTVLAAHFAIVIANARTYGVDATV